MKRRTTEDPLRTCEEESRRTWEECVPVVNVVSMKDLMASRGGGGGGAVAKGCGPALEAVLLCSQVHGRLGKHFLPCTPPVRGSFQPRTVWFWCRPALTESALSRPKAGATRMTWCLLSNAGSSRHHVGLLSTQDDFQAPSERAGDKRPQRGDKRPFKRPSAPRSLYQLTNGECVSAAH